MIQGKRMEKRGKGKGRIAAVLAAVLLVTSVTAVTGSADCVADLKNCAVSVSLPSVKADDTSFDEIKDAAVVLDFYQVVPAKDLTGYDAYTFEEWNSAFVSASPGKNWEALSEKAEKNTLTAEDLNGFTQSLAAVVLSGKGKPDVVATAPLSKDKPAQVTVPGGMYLILAHSSKDTAVSSYVEEKDGVYTTKAAAATKTYHFSPMLVTAPVRKDATALDPAEIAAGEEGTSIIVPAGYSNTAEDSGAWAESVELVAKVGVSEDQEGALKITKNLQTYEHMEGRNDKATFIFRIEAEGYRGEVESIVLENGKLSGSVTVEHLPVGKEITVTEVTPMGDYDAVGPISWKGTITSSEAIPEAVFTNRHNGGYKGGGSVKNTYGTTKAAEGTTWSWNSTPQQTIADDTSIR